jgi:hypothetical protein
MDRTKDHAGSLAQLRALLAHGVTFAAAAGLMGRSATSLYRLAKLHRLPRRRRALSASRKRNLELAIAEARLTLSAIARLCGVSKHTVWACRQRLADEGQEFAPQRLREPVHCPAGHLSHYQPCVICRADKELQRV